MSEFANLNDVRALLEKYDGQIISAFAERLKYANGDSKVENVIKNIPESNKLFEKNIISKYYSFLDGLYDTTIKDNQYLNASKEVLESLDSSVLGRIVPRLSLGIAIAYAKAYENPKTYALLIDSKDREKIEETVTNKQQEQKVIEHIKEIASKYDTSISEPFSDIVVRLYKELIIPETIKLEVDFLSSMEKHTIFSSSDTPAS